MRKQYYFRPSRRGYFAWDVDRLIELSRTMKPQTIPINAIVEIDENFWFQDEKNKPTCRSVIEHMKLINEVDTGYPIILSSDGRVMDGMHRVARSLLDGMETIKAVQFSEDPEPDYKDIYPENLPY